MTFFMCRISSAWILMSERRAADAAGGLVHEDAGVGGGVALALGAGGEQELAHGRGEAGGDRDNIVRDELHGVVDGHAGGDGAAG